MARIVVLGAGIAGLAAARALSPFHEVTIVEEADAPGGIGETLSCKAGEDCSVCSACTVPELVDEVLEDETIRLLARTTLTSSRRSNDERWSLSLAGEGAGELEADAVIVATGVDVLDGGSLPELGAGRLEGVTTALELDRFLRGVGEAGAGGEDTIDLEDTSSVAFIQCVCSRDTGELPYCSRVCCAYTARLALEVRDRYPGSQVTVFYMDLQQGDAVAANQLAKARADPGIEYVRSRPASVQGLPGGGLEVLYEDTLACEIATRSFDVVVLSTGIVPSEGTRRVSDALSLETDAYGFVCTGGKATSQTSQAGVLAAGGATGPVDLVEAAMGGLAAAATAMADHPPEWPGYPPRVIVAGEEPMLTEAEGAARAVGADTATIMGGPGSGLQRLEGEPGGFVACMGGCGTDMSMALKGDVVVVAPRPGREPAMAHQGATTYRDAWIALDGGEPGPDGTARYVILMDEGPEALVIASAILQRRPDAQVDVLFSEMAIAEEGMQELQLELASKGARFHRTSPRDLRAEWLDGGTVEVGFRDQLCPDLGEVRLVADRLVGPEAEEDGGDLVWPWFLSRHAPRGVPTSARVNVTPVLTPRRGVYTTTPGTITGPAVALGGAAAVAMALADYARGFPVEEEVAQVDPDLCAVCLNCLRVCPHDAIVIDEETGAARVLVRACQDCGLCAGICPAEAISMVPGSEAGGEGQ